MLEILMLYYSILPSMTCTDVICYKQIPSVIEGKLDWDVIDINNWDRLQATWDKEGMISKITHLNGEVETTKMI